MTNEHQAQQRNVLRVRRPGQTMKAAERKRVQEAFLAAFCLEANMSQACRVAGIERSTVLRWCESDEKFKERYEEASEEANDAIDAEIFRRAVYGWKEPMVSAGVLVCHVEKYSDSLLTLLAKARMKKYRDKQPDIDVNVHINQVAEQAKEELLADLAELTNEDQAPPH